MLETIREYAAEQLASAGREEALRERHAAWFVGVAEQAGATLMSADKRVALDRLELELLHAQVGRQRLQLRIDLEALVILIELREPLVDAVRGQHVLVVIAPLFECADRRGLDPNYGAAG